LLFNRIPLVSLQKYYIEARDKALFGKNYPIQWTKRKKMQMKKSVEKHMSIMEEMEKAVCLDGFDEKTESLKKTELGKKTQYFSELRNTIHKGKDNLMSMSSLSPLDLNISQSPSRSFLIHPSPSNLRERFLGSNLKQDSEDSAKILLSEPQTIDPYIEETPVDKAIKRMIVQVTIYIFIYFLFFTK
jgi:hypothetical protein